MLPYDIICKLFDFIDPGADAAAFGVSCKETARAWKSVGIAKTLIKLLSPVVVTEKSGEIVFIVATEVQTKRFIRFISALNIVECVNILEVYLGKEIFESKRIRIKLTFEEMRNMEKQKTYELLIIKSGLLKELKRRFGSAVLDIAYTKGHKITWNCM